MTKAKDEAKGTIDAPIVVSFKQFVDYAFALWLDALKTGVPSKTLCLLGSPGIGKSSTAHALAKRMGDYIRANPALIFKNAGIPPLDKIVPAKRLLDFSSMLPEDLNGLPKIVDGVTTYCPQQWVHELVGDTAFGVVVQDDLPAATPAMHTAGRQMALERRIHDHRFAPGVQIIVTGNRREDKAGAHTLPSHFRNSVTLLAIEPDLDEWKKWYANEEGHDPIISAFLTWQPSLFSKTAQDEDKSGAFPTPRQWSSVGRQFQVAKGIGPDMLYAVAAGCVGKAAATTFIGFVEVYAELPDPGKVLDNPKAEMPNPSVTLDRPDKQIAMTCALGDMAARRSKSSKASEKNEAALKLMRALAHVCANSGEYVATGIQSFLDAGGQILAVAKIARDHRTDPTVSPMLDHIKDALLGGNS